MSSSQISPEEFGDLLGEPSTCAARRAGDICGAEARYRVGDIDVCLHHHRRAIDWFLKRIEHVPERREEARRVAAEKERLAAEARSIVYYLHSQSAGLIKIGFSTNYPVRLSDLKAEHGPLRLLLATAGGRKQENEAHKAFAAHHVRGEWFQANKRLLLDILRMREAARYRTETRLPEQIPLREIRAMIREIQAAERAARAG